jgi:hypothetical protein
MWKKTQDPEKTRRKAAEREETLHLAKDDQALIKAVAGMKEFECIPIERMYLDRALAREVIALRASMQKLLDIE